jgi:hypothetical protein
VSLLAPLALSAAPFACSWSIVHSFTAIPIEPNAGDGTRFLSQICRAPGVISLNFNGVDAYRRFGFTSALPSLRPSAARMPCLPFSKTLPAVWRTSSACLRKSSESREAALPTSFPKWAGLIGLCFNPGGCALQPSKPTSIPRCNIHDAYERAEKVGFSWRARHWTFRLPSVETTARPASVR